MYYAFVTPRIRPIVRVSEYVSLPWFVSVCLVNVYVCACVSYHIPWAYVVCNLGARFYGHQELEDHSGFSIHGHFSKSFAGNGEDQTRLLRFFWAFFQNNYRRTFCRVFVDFFSMLAEVKDIYSGSPGVPSVARCLFR